MIKQGSLWLGGDKEFQVLHIGANGENEGNIIFYQNIKTKESYSCREGAFLSRFTEIKNRG